MIKPCPPKKDAKGANKTPAVVDDDAPGIGARIETDAPTANQAVAAANKSAMETERSFVQSLVAPGAVFVVVGVLVMRVYAGDHKKDA